MGCAFLLLSFLCSITTATLLSAVDTEGVEDASNNVIANTRQVANSSSADQDDGVLLKIVVLTRNIGSNLATIRQPDAGDLSQSGVGLLGRHGADTKADPSSLGTSLQVHGLPLGGYLAACASDELVGGGHKEYSVLELADGMGQGLLDGLFGDLNFEGLWRLGEAFYTHVHIRLESSAGRDEMSHDNIFL